MQTRKQISSFGQSFISTIKRPKRAFFNIAPSAQFWATAPSLRLNKPRLPLIFSLPPSLSLPSRAYDRKQHVRLVGKEGTSDPRSEFNDQFEFVMDEL
jgi:hypothetical protein